MASHSLLISTLGGGFLGGVLLGMFTPLWDALSPGFATQRLRPLRLFFILTLVPLMLLAAQVLDKWAGVEGQYQALILGALLSTTGLGVLAVRDTFRAALLGGLLLSAAAACLLPAATLLMTQAMAIADGPVHALNLGYVAVGAGVLVGTPLLAWLQNRFDFRRGVLFLATLTLLYGTFAALAPRPALRAPFVPVSDPRFTLRLGLACLVVVFYFPLEGSLGSWATHYLKDLAYKAHRIPLILAFFWLVFLGTRVTTGLFLRAGYEALVLFMLVSAIAVTFCNLAGAGPSSGAKGMLVMWACHGPVFPTLLGLLLPMASAPATAFAILFGLGAVSSLMFQPMLVSYAATHTAQSTLKLPGVLAILLAAPAGILALI